MTKNTAEIRQHKSKRKQKHNAENRHAKNAPKQLASIQETMSFVFGCGIRSRVLFAVGSFAALLNGLVGPTLAALFAVGLARASSLDFEDVAFEDIQKVCLGLVMIGVWAFVMTFIQTICFEIVAFHGAHSLNLQWFEALLRQDAAFFDVYDVPSIASLIQPTCYMYRRGMGAKFGEGIQYVTTVICGIAFAFVASWRISILVLAILPVCIACSVYAIHLSQTKTSRSNMAYQKAGAVAYTTISSLRTVLAFNGIPHMISQYRKATEEARRTSSKFLFQYGATTGEHLSVLASCMILCMASQHSLVQFP
jgi:ATP-binding cassette, subfamily B (MDR/TAP), member 1